MKFVESDDRIDAYLKDNKIGTFERRRAGKYYHWYFYQTAVWLSVTDLQELRDKSVALSMMEHELSQSGG